MKYPLNVTTALLAASIGALASAQSFNEEGTRQLTWADFDVDGNVDAFVVHPTGGVALFRSLGDGRFEDATATSGLARLSGALKALWSDYDQDGLPDLFVLSSQGEGRLFQNRAGAFADVTELAGIAVFGAHDASWTDYDGDARPDLVLQATGGHRLYHNLGEAFEVVDLPFAIASAPGSGPGAATELSEGSVGSDEGVGRRSENGTSDDATDGPPAGAGPGTNGGGSNWNLGSGSGGSFVVNPGPPAMPMGFCSNSVVDQATSVCVQASSIPALGMLYPLGTEFSIDASGNVGIGTTSPLGRLQLQSADIGLGVSTLYNDDIIVEASDAVLGLYSTSGGSWGSALAMAEVDAAGMLVDKWSMARTTSQASSRLRFAYGSNNQYNLNSAVLTLDSDGQVGIGTTAPDTPLHVFNGATSGRGARIENDDVSNASDVMLLYHNGAGRALYAFTDAGEEAILADGKTGIRAIGDDGGYAIDASNNIGVGMRVTSSSSVGAFVTGGTDTLAALEVHGTGATTPIAANFKGAVRVGYPGAFGLTIPRVEIRSDADNAGEIFMEDQNGLATVEIKAQEFAASGGAQILLRQSDGTASITLDADHNGSGRVITEVLQITGGADLVESFDTGEEACEPGTVVVIDATNPGELATSTRAYDKRVAGIVSGANGIRAGLHMGQDGVASGDTPVALSGRVYVKCSTENGAVEPGDLLTTAALAGHAMKATDSGRAFGSVIGKAMSALDAETGLVLVLVSLQ